MKKVLVIIPYENLYPPLNGGMQRCFHVLVQLAKYFDVTAIINQDKSSFLKSADKFPEVKGIKVYNPAVNRRPDLFSLLPAPLENALRYRWLQKSFKGPADSHFLKYYETLRALLTSQGFDIIVLENLATLNATSFIRRYQKNAILVYDAHNVDSYLAKDPIAVGQLHPSALKMIERVESNLHKTVDKIMSCSSKDVQSFKELNKGELEIAEIPNGVVFDKQIENNAVQSDQPDKLIFCGSLTYGPNTEGLLWFYKNVWPLVLRKAGHLKLMIVGSGKPDPAIEAMKNDPTIQFEGQVADVREYYKLAALSIVPVNSGSGTRLKILEAMSFGVPVLSTSKGAEGIDYSDGLNINIADSAESFADKVVSLLAEKNYRLSISTNARKLIREKYDWNVVGKKMYEFLNNSTHD